MTNEPATSREMAQEAIRKHLKRSHQDARSIVDLLTDDEIEQIAGHLDNRVGAFCD